MTAQEKAKELVDKFGNIKHWQYTTGYYVGTKMTLQDAKQCAIICVDEILSESESQYEYWQEVKAEIEKM
jgi:hypothetical protein